MENVFFSIGDFQAGPARGEPIKGVPGALVLGGDYQGLGVVRSLGRHGIPVYVVDDEPSISRFSRYTTRWIRVPDLRDYARVIASLMEIGRRFDLQGWVLFPTRDEIVAALSLARTELLSIFRVPTPAWETVCKAWDKRLTYKLAAALGIPTPRTRFARDPSELKGLDLDFPCALKPAIKEHFIYATQLKALMANSREELDRLFRRACTVIPAEELMIQEFIPGDGERQFSYCSFFKDGKPLAKMVVRRARQRPREFGRSSTFVETLDLPELEGPSEKLLSAMGYYGLTEVEYKYDVRDQRFKLLDVNPRTWGSHSIGARAGVDFPYMLFRDQLAQTVTPARAKPGIRWVHLLTDLPTGAREVLSGRLSVGAFLRSLTGFDTEAVWAKDDIRPAFVEMALLPHLISTRGNGRWQGESVLTLVLLSVLSAVNADDLDQLFMALDSIPA